MRPKLSEIMLKQDENAEIVGDVATDFKLVMQGGKLTKLKIRFLHGATIYVPLSKAMGERKALTVETTASYVV